MGRSSNRIRANKFFKYLTIGASSLGIITSGVFAATLAIDATNKDFINDNVREYTASFSSEGALITSNTYKRGDLLELPANPEHTMDGEGLYFFLGWDTNKNGIPDYIPSRMYYSFEAEAVYFKIGAFDLSFLDLANMDLESLLDLMNDLNIDWEQFMDMFNIDPETLLDWLMQNKILTFESDGSAYISYFRSTSFGDYNFQTSQFNAPAFYDSTLIRSGSINPLSYTADKLKNAYALVGTLPENFNFVNYDITFCAPQDYYPVPDCEYNGDSEMDIIDSDAHYLKEPIDMKYQTEAAYVPAMKEVIDILSLVPFSNQAITKDEKDYYKYALEHYTSIPSEYESLIDAIIDKNKWVEEDYSQVNNIGAYVESLGACSMFKDGQVNLDYEKNKDPVRGLIENKQGTDLDFNVTAMMIARRLNIPARVVKGYVVPAVQPGTNDITMLNQHYWCEIYVKNIGWMIFDCMNAEEFLGTNPYGELDKESNPFEDQHELIDIKVTKKPTKLEYYIGDTIDPSGAEVTAYYGDETNKKLNLYSGSISVDPIFFTEEGEIPVTVTYTEDGITKSDTFNVTVTKKPAQVSYVKFNFDDVQKEFFLNDIFSDDGIIAEAYYDDGTVVDVSSQVKTVGASQTLYQLGTFVISAFVEIDDKTFNDTYEINVIKDSVVDLKVTTLPTKLTYYTGDSFDRTGMVVKVTYLSGESNTYSGYNLSNSSLEFLNVDLSYPNDHHVITVRFNNDDGTYAEDSFEIEVIKNEITNIDPHNFKTEYGAGDVFTEDEFATNQSYIEITMTNGTKVKIYKDDIVDITTPDLGAVGDTSSIVTFKYEGELVNVEIPITVTGVNPDAFAISSHVSTSGPGSISGTSVFDYTVTRGGTYYFRNASYDTYSPTKGWSNETKLDAQTDGFTYSKLSQVYETSEIGIHFNKDIVNGLTPNYSSSSPTYNSDLFSDSALAGSDITYESTNFVLTPQTANRLVNYINFPTSQQNAYNSVRNSSDFQTFLSVFASDASSSLIQDYINSHFYYSYYTYNLAEKIELILQVQHDISTEFTYNIDFKYPSDQDPIQSFFEQGEGICNNFATVATMVYRQLGIPARYVVGFGSSASGAGTYSVSASNAHAWTEVFIDNLGWVTVDATGYDDGHTTGSGYGTGFGGSGFENPRIAYGGEIKINYNYSKYFQDGSSSGTGWYMVFNNKDYHDELYSLSYVNGSQLPSDLEAVITWEWEINGVDYGEWPPSMSDSGFYSLTPTLHIYDKAQAYLDVTSDYGYYLSSDTENMEYTIFPCCIYVETYIIGGSAYSIAADGYDIGGGVTAIILSPYADIGLNINKSTDPDNPLLEMADTLPNNVEITLYGTFIVSEAGDYTLSFEVVAEGDSIPSDCLVIVLTYSDGSYLNPNNFVIINVGGNVEVNP